MTMPINLDEALGAELGPVEFSWTSSDVQLYHLGLGAGALTASLPCSTLLNSMSMPGNLTVGGSVMWKLWATLPNVGSTWGVLSIR